MFAFEQKKFLISRVYVHGLLFLSLYFSLNLSVLVCVCVYVSDTYSYCHKRAFTLQYNSWLSLRKIGVVGLLWSGLIQCDPLRINCMSMRAVLAISIFDGLAGCRVAAAQSSTAPGSAVGEAVTFMVCSFLQHVRKGEQK